MAKENAVATTGVTVSEISASDFEKMADFKSVPPVSGDRDFESQAAAAVRALSEIDKVEPYSPAPSETQKPVTSPVDFDFGAINLDLQPTPEPSASSTPAPMPARVGSVEMDTKIELAAAYVGIGDKEGARELLEEVIQEGSPEQVEKAKEALAKIS